MVDMYGRAAAYERCKAAMCSWPIVAEDRRLIRRYLENQIDHLSPGRRYSDIVMLKRLFCGTKGWRQRGPAPPLVTTPLAALTLDDFRTIRARIRVAVTNRDSFRKITEHLRNLYNDAFARDPSKGAILDTLFLTGKRRFFHWPNNGPVNTSITEDRYYTIDEFLRLLRVAQRPIARALLALAWETTARPNEYLSLRCGDVTDHPNGFVFKAHISKKRSGETTLRQLYLFAFRADFNAFWRSHAYRDNPQAPLFYREDNRTHHGQPLGPAGANKLLKRLDDLSGVKKCGTLYFLRHGGYTWKRTQGMNPALADRDMGWVPGTKQQRRYLHVQDEDVLNERLRLANETPGAPPPPEITAPICGFCQHVNSPTDTRCVACGQTLNLHEVVAERDAHRALIESLVDAKLKAILEKHGLTAVR